MTHFLAVMHVLRTDFIIAFFFLSACAASAEQHELIGREAVWMIVMNTPDVIRLEGRDGCPAVEIIPEGRFLMSVQLRNSCSKQGNGMIDNYTVDLRTAQIWTGVDDRRYIDSDRLRRLRVLLGIR